MNITKADFSQVPDLYQKHIDQCRTCLIEITVNCFTLFEVSNEVLIMIKTEIQALGVCFWFGFFCLVFEGVGWFL